MKKVLTIAVCLVIALAFAGKAYSLDATTTAKDTAKTTATSTTNTAKTTATTAATNTVTKDKVKVEETAKGTVTKEKETLKTPTNDTVKVNAKETTTATGTDVKAKITEKPTVADTAKTGLTQEKVTFKSYNANNNTITVIKDKKEMTVPVKNPAHWANTKQFENKTITYTSTYDPKMLTQVATDPKLAE